MIYTPHQIFMGDQIENKKGGGCSTCGGEERCIQSWWGNLRERDHLEDTGVDGRVILRWLFREWDGGIDCIDLVHDRDRWRALLKAAMNLRVPKKFGEFVD
jgi:hypothetical protein